MPMGFWARAVANINSVWKQTLVKVFLFDWGFLRFEMKIVLFQPKKKKSQRKGKNLPKFDLCSLQLELLVFV